MEEGRGKQKEVVYEVSEGFMAVLQLSLLAAKKIKRF
jgi:hypothetical protein